MEEEVDMRRVNPYMMAFRTRLQYRVILVVFIVLLIMGLVGGGTILYLQRQATTAHFTESTIMLATALRDSLERDMLLVDREHIQQSVELMASRRPVNEITIVSAQGRVFASSDASIVGEQWEDEDISRALALGIAVTRVQPAPSRNLDVALPVLNKPDCYGCHGSTPQILGAIEMAVDRGLLDTQLQEQSLIMVIIAGITFLMIGATLTYMFRSSVVNPISKLIASAGRIAGGDLSARVEIRRDDEVGMMASSFNEMAERVEQNARALEASKAELEEKVQERTKQLRETAGIRGQLLERLITAQEEERHRVARELHDEAGQALSAIMLDLARAIDALPETATEARQRLSQSRALAAQTLGELRKLIYDLRPEVLDQLGLAPALRSYVKSRLEARNIRVRLSLSGLDRRLTPQMETTIFRIIQEATTNVVRHSNATRVDIELEATDSAVEASIEDNGQGFDVERALQTPGSWGLRGIRERVSLVGGQLDIKSEPGKSTQIRFAIPLEGETYE
jgi:signal transduction histidine kinase